MMNFRDTGLPQDDMNVFKAYSTYAKNAKDMAQSTGMSEDFGIRIAQALNAGGASSEAIVTGLLSTTPVAAWSVFERTFGKDVVATMEETAKHMRTGYAYIDQAGDGAKLLSLATAMALFDELKAKNEKTEQQLDNFRNGMTDPRELEAMLPGMIQGMLPNTGVYARMSDSLAGATSLPQLEQAFASKLEDFKFSQQEQQEKMAQFGIIVSGPGNGPMGAPAEVRYPSFEETGLLDEPKVRAAYEVLTSNPRVAPEDFEGAIAAGKLLTDLPASKNPVAVAGALLDIGIRDLNTDDFQFLDKKLDWDVLDLVRHHSVRAPVPTAVIQAAPVEFRQIVVANLTSQLEHLREGAQGMLDRLSNPPEDMPMGMEVPPELRQMMEAQTVQQVQGVSAAAQRAVRPLFGSLDAPELEAAFKQRVQALQEFVQQHAPKAQSDFPDFPTRRKPGAGDNFSF